MRDEGCSWWKTKSLSGFGLSPFSQGFPSTLSRGRRLGLEENLESIWFHQRSPLKSHRTVTTPTGEGSYPLTRCPGLNVCLTGGDETTGNQQTDLSTNDRSRKTVQRLNGLLFVQST